LKNLGGWIGQLTLSRNKPICFKYLNIKLLLAESFQYINRLTIILPIICKILECAKDSIFKLYNPWLNPILCLLEEIKNKEQIKTGIKCEILICFQKLGVQPEKLENKKLLEL
jgi:CCR4-NOT transcription complex subunit 1